MSKNTSNTGFLSKNFTFIVIALSILVGELIYFFVLGNPENFIDNDPNNHPKPGNILGIVYKGGFIVPFLIAQLIIVITVSIERLISISKAQGKGLGAYINKLRNQIGAGQIDQAIVDAKKHKSSLANVMLAGLEKYKEVEADASLSGEDKVNLVQKDLAEATTLELPMLQRNLIVISTLVSVATLVGLIGTVSGMIKAFSALASSGTPDAAALSAGISEALICTMLGISTSVIAIIAYSYFSSVIESLTNKMEESGFTLVKSMAKKHKVVLED